MRIKCYRYTDKGLLLKDSLAISFGRWLRLRCSGRTVVRCVICQRPVEVPRYPIPRERVSCDCGCVLRFLAWTRPTLNRGA